MAALKLYLFGPPQVEQDETPIEINRRKAMALLAYLAVTNRSHSRDALATLFWPDAGQSRARGTLRRVLSDLNKALGDSWLNTDGETVSFNSAVGLWVDVTAFQELLAGCRDDLTAPCLAAVVDAVALYRDDFLAGFTLPDTPEFDDWQFFQTETLRRMLAGALEQLVAYHAAQHDFNAAIPYARRWVALDPLLEAPHRALMKLYAQTGQRSAALRQYQQCAEQLQDELGIAPTEETTALYERIRRGKELPPPQPEPDEAAAADLPDIREAKTPSPQYQDEIRLVTVLFAGLAHAGEVDWELEPEEIAARTEALSEIVGEIAADYQARLDQVGGDGIQAIFGIPRAHEDDPERAVRAALEIQAQAKARRLQVTIGLSTGQVYFSPTGAQGQETIAMGAVVNLAARLQDRAGQILASPAAYRHTRRAFEFDPVEVTVGGAAGALTAYQPRRALPRPEKVRGIEGLQAQLIGRDAEVTQLKALLAAALYGSGQIVSLVGEAGVGKTRLVAELRQSAVGLPRPLLWLEGRCLEFRQATSYWPFIDLLQSYLSAGSPDDRDRARCLVSELEALVQQGFLAGNRLEEVGVLLGNLLSIQFGADWDERLKNTSRDELRHRTFAAVREFLAALALRQPLVLVFEDLHWADDLSLDLLATLLKIIPASPILLLAVYRPALHPKAAQLAQLAAQNHPQAYTAVHLREFSSQTSRHLLDSLLGKHDLPSSVINLILTKSRGNPFFVEEAVRALIDSGAVARVDGCWSAQTEIESIAVPESVQSVIQDRVDSLKPALRQILQVAAVVGRLFRRSIIEAMLPPDAELDRALPALEEAALIYQERTTPEMEYSFKHVLTQETVYQTLSRQRRSRLHQSAAQAIENLYAGNLKEYYEQLAYHYDRSEAKEKAVDYLIKAGQKSGEAYFNEEAIHYLGKALGRLDALAGDQALPAQTMLTWRLMALSSLGEIHHGIGREQEAERYLRQAIDVGKAAGVATPELVRLHYWLGETLHWQGRSAEQARVGEAGQALLAIDDAESFEAALTNQIQAIAHLQQGNAARFQSLTEQTARFIKRLPYSAELRPAYLHIVINCYHQKKINEAMAWLEHLETLAREHYDWRAMAEAIEHRWGPTFERGDLSGSIANFERVLELYNNIGDNSRTWRYLGSIVWTLLMQGKLAEAEKYSAMELATVKKLGVHVFESDSYINRGMLLLSRRRWAEAATAFEQVVLADQQPVWLQWIARYCLARAHTAAGHRAAALAQYRAALELSNPYVTTYRVGWRFRWWPVFAGILSGLETALDDPAQFRAICGRLQEAPLPPAGVLPLDRWYLEPAPDAASAPAAKLLIDEVFSGPLDPDWRWQDPFDDCAFEVQNRLEIRAANGRDLWHINHSAPRLLRQISGDFVVQTVCTPLADHPSEALSPAPTLGGIVLWKDDQNFVRLVRGSRGPRDISFEGCLNNEDVVIGRGRLPAEAAEHNSSQGSEADRFFLRLERQGNHVQALCSADGEQWFSAGQVELPAADPLEVGLHAVGWIDRTIYPGAFPNGAGIRFESVRVWRTR